MLTFLKGLSSYKDGVIGKTFTAYTLYIDNSVVV